MPATAQKKRYAKRVVELLRREYPDAHCSLDYRTPLELLIATILSAQCTDVRVNLVTPGLFRHYRSAQDFAQAPTAKLEQEIKSTGFFRNKAKSIQGCCRKLVDDYGGQVPQELDQLVQLPGVGRKTANVVLGSGFGIPSGVVVDTHVTRLAQRLGLTTATDAVKIEQDLMQQLPKKEWIGFSHRLIWHGRQVCVARKPRCSACVLSKVCPRIGVTSHA
jgi:endonuclease-3